MLDRVAETVTAAAERWLADLTEALGTGDPAAVGRLFAADSHWRDLVALTWHITTVSGRERLAVALTGTARTQGLGAIEVDPARTPPRRVERAGRETVEAIVRFETATGRGSGVVRLVPADGEPGRLVGWTIATALEEIKGHAEGTGAHRPTGEVYSRDFSGPNWLDRRIAAVAYEDRDPAVVVVGGGQAGLSVAARLTQLGIDTLVIEKEARIGDNWRKRYHALTLHNQVHVNHLPYMPFPPNAPVYLPKDKLAAWFEAYAEAMELNVWTSAEFLGGAYDGADGHWTVKVRRTGGTVRTMRPRHVVMATGVSGIPILPKIDTIERFRGPVLHSSLYGDSHEAAGQNVLVVGTGTSGHDLAQDLTSHGAHVTMVQRSPTTVVNVEPTAQLPYALYGEGLPLEDCDLIASASPLGVVRTTHEILTRTAFELDMPLLKALERVGFRIDWDDTTGWQFKYLSRGGGYYFNVGCSEMIAAGEIGLVQASDIETFTEGGVRLTSGREIPLDLVVLATGYKNQDALLRILFGDPLADRVGPVWGIDRDAQELNNMFVRTPQPGLWFIAGSFAQCRIYSKYLALQIKACELGLISPDLGQPTDGREPVATS